MHDAHSLPHLPGTIRLADYAPPDWLIPDVALEFRLGLDVTEVRARLSVRRNGSHDRPLVLDGQGLVTHDVRVDGAPSAARPRGDQLVLVIDADSAIVETVVGVQPSRNTRLMGLYASQGRLVTQCEAEGFRAITWFPDRPDILSVYTVRLIGDRHAFPVLLSNGNRGAVEELGEAHAVTWHDPWPKPCYLFALVAGDLSALTDRFTTQSGRDVDLAIWTAAADVPRAVHAMSALKASMAWDERCYGREYDLAEFNIVAVADFNAGAMENKGLNIFNSKFILADSETATDADFDAIAAVVAHEYFHNWTGNRVTCRDWFQLSLKEGLTVFRDQQFMADQGSPAVKRIDDVRGLRAVQFPEDAGPLAHPIRPDHYVEIANFYTATVYNKGAEVIRMLHSLLGPEGFRSGTDLYFDRHDGQAVTCEDWLAAMADATQRDLTLFQRWYGQAGTPRLTVRSVEANGKVAVTIIQQVPATPMQPIKQPVHMPFRLALIGRRSGQRLGAERLVEVTDAETRIVFDDVGEPALLSLNRGFSAPVIVDSPATRAELAFLAGHDDDPFARWEAMQRLALDVLATDDSLELVEAVQATLAAGRDGRLDPAFVAEAVLLPTESFIGDQAAIVDVEGIHRRREAARRAIATALADDWWDMWRRHGSSGTALTPAAKGSRRLANVALAYLTCAGSAEAITAASRQYGSAATMTDRLGALTALINTMAPERDAALADFHARFAGNADVIDKWFTVQALGHRADTLDRVRDLLDHPDYNPANPNRLRALVGAFGANQRYFHLASGEGYRLLADQLLAVDRLNPQSAARLAVPLGRWRRFDAGRAAMMKAELERIVASPGVSKDVLEMAGRALG